MTTPSEPQPDPGLLEVILASLVQAAEDSHDPPDSDTAEDTPDSGSGDAPEGQDAGTDDFIQWLAVRLAVDVQTYLEQQQ
jgi:hypothetical protein